MLGSHSLNSWSTTQPSISLSLGEAGYYGVVKAAWIAIGQQPSMEDIGIKVGVRVWTDSSAAMGVLRAFRARQVPSFADAYPRGPGARSNGGHSA